MTCFQHGVVAAAAWAVAPSRSSRARAAVERKVFSGAILSKRTSPSVPRKPMPPNAGCRRGVDGIVGSVSDGDEPRIGKL
jgi:hypothetical protein